MEKHAQSGAERKLKSCLAEGAQATGLGGAVKDGAGMGSLSDAMLASMCGPVYMDAGVDADGVLDPDAGAPGGGSE